MPSKTPFYRVVRGRAFLGVPLADVEVAMGPEAYALAAPVLLAHVVGEPETVEVADGAAPEDLVAVEVAAFQVDAGLNEIPRATCVLAHGRDARAAAAGHDPEFQVAVAHVLGQYLGTHVRAKLYLRRETTAASGVYDGGDNGPLPGEWECVFDGFAVAPAVRGSAADHSYVLQLTHFLAALTYSSALSGDVAAGTGNPAVFSPTAFFQTTTGAFSFTPAGAAACQLAGGPALYADFWGFQPLSTDRTGVKGFLDNLAGKNEFNRGGFLLNGATAGTCDSGSGRNELARNALRRIEPLTPDGFDQGDWPGLADLMRNVFQGGGNAGRTGITRQDVVARKGEEFYATLGYRYGVPLAFYLANAAFDQRGGGTSFANDIVRATWAELGPASFWELLSVRYPTNYQLAVAPAATRAVVVPAVVGGPGGRYWRTVYASEIDDWADNLANPVPVRGVLLIGNRGSFTGAFTAGAAPLTTLLAGSLAYMDGVYDSCRPGVFVTRDMPTWLVGAARPTAALVPNAPRVMAASPRASAAFAPVADPAPGMPAAARSTANRLAKALYQQARLLPRTLSVTTRFRTDIAPGSLVRFETPADRFVRKTLGTTENPFLSGLVTRMSLTYDAQGQRAATSLQVGFVRTEAETAPTNPLYVDGHPFWATVCYGLPWADSGSIRAELGARATLDPDPVPAIPPAAP